MGVYLDPLHDVQRVPDLPDLPQAGELSAPPPREQLPSILASIQDAVKNLPDGTTAAVVGQASRQGWNAGVLVKTDSGWNVHAWIGDTDWHTGGIDYGVEVLKTWKLGGKR